jgi:hypothetical protein
MDHQFLLPVMYKGVEMQFEARAQVWAYRRRFYILIEGQVDGIQDRFRFKQFANCPLAITGYDFVTNCLGKPAAWR